MIGLDIQQLGLEAALGAILGGLIGYGFKKIATILAVVVGVQLAVFRFLEARGILTVDYERLTAGLLGHREAAAVPPDWTVTILSTLSITGGFALGFFVGYKRG